MKKHQKLFAAILIITTLVSSMIIPASAASEWILHAATALEEGQYNFEFGLHDVDHGGTPDLICVKKRNVQNTEIHVLRGECGYRQFIYHVATILPAGRNDYHYLVGDLNNDNYCDVLALKVRNTKQTIAYALDGADNWQSYLYTQTLPIEAAYENWCWSLADRDADGVLDLYGIKLKSASKKVECHVLSGSSQLKTFLQHETTILPQTDYSTFRCLVGDYDGDAIPDIIAAKIAHSSSGSVEYHVVSGISGYKAFVLQTATKLEISGAFDYLLHDMDKNNVLDFVAIKRFSTGSHRTELHSLTIPNAQEQGVKRTTVFPILGSEYTDQHNYPYYKTGGYHGGLDIAAAKGTPIFSPYFATVEYTGDLKNSYGKHIILKTTIDGETRYIYLCHLNSIDVVKGQIVSAGEQIATLGNTGKSTGPHVHIEFRNEKRSFYNALNPYDYLPQK